MHTGVRRVYDYAKLFKVRKTRKMPLEAIDIICLSVIMQILCI